jgi:hypothetical protein
MTPRNAGLAALITLAILAGTAEAITTLILTTRPRLERWQARRAYGTGLYPR